MSTIQKTNKDEARDMSKTFLRNKTHVSFPVFLRLKSVTHDKKRQSMDIRK